jgi:hypothetical protein
MSICLQYFNQLNWFYLVWFLVFNATFSNSSAISWRPVLVVEKSGEPGETHRPWASIFSHCTGYHNYIHVKIVAGDLALYLITDLNTWYM